MNLAPQASTPSAPGSQGTSAPRFLATVLAASVSAAVRYFSASTGDTVSVAALLSNPSRFSSVGKSRAGWLVSPSRSRMVLSYSVRVRRRMYDGPGSATAPLHSGLLPVDDGGDVCTTPICPTHESDSASDTVVAQRATR